MPIYEYECTRCGHRFEAIQKMSDPVFTDCPSCGLPELKKLMSAAGFQLKGTGWYATDFKGGGKKQDSQKPDDQKKDDKKDDKKKESSSDSSDTTPPKKNADGCGGGCAH